jgi:hypothetical protein
LLKPCKPLTATIRMGRQKSIARSTAAPLSGSNKLPHTKLGRLLAAFSALFSLYQLPLDKIRPDVFEKLRTDCWLVKDEDYAAAFRPDSEGNAQALHPIGDMGFSGSVSCPVLISTRAKE